MFDIDNLIERWEDVGLLDGLPERLKGIVSLKYELITKIIVENDHYIDETHLLNCIFPIVYRIYNGGKVILNEEDFVSEVYHFFNTSTQLMREIEISYPQSDVEAEMTAIFVERYDVNKEIKNIEPIKWINRHKL
jgi:hypothetical protein